ncbi:FkbM family methyltransferase [Dyadobacter sp. CY261]|uniref:FkbM family methyltransferase n=1 Tax=Dyadobacter sp. CY261 TaxID=2907203 RepID=UPI001F00C1B6|nr:FkbM family methyltransferase [Dyadobacter sp. CY261]MCF0068942.1 FkbM family methyltransferase [Dyadobacter sp. CY261]
MYKIRTLASDENEKVIFRFLELVPEDSIILDIGANLGFISFHLAQRRGCQVLAFEPMPDNIATINRVIASQKLTNVTLCPIALGDSEGSLTMVMPLNGKIPMQGLSHVAQESDLSSGLTFTVPVKRLDDLPEINNASKRVGGIKIDVEDYEYFVLKGGNALLERDHPVICIELWENENRPKVLNYLTGLGYVPHILDNNQLRPFTDMNEKINTNNFICIATNA